MSKIEPMLTTEEVVHLWDTHVGYPTESLPLKPEEITAFAELILSKLTAKDVQGVEPVAIHEGKDLFWIAGCEPDDELSGHLYTAAQISAVTAKKDAALTVCLLALERSRKSANARGFDLMDSSSAQKYWYALRDDCDAAITQVREVLK